ncbi:TAT-variant-translocated molybdopterin oxidoreductase [Myxococcus sp. K38C18041901]|uniref:TAT-variant-translocated molybdopterin oxidoreductase n=1 Tax=Myxococcus guangdongensis TaxID=2906760 RepID=UPI0020A7BE27|nr:TAT-variant-translocated molybdopterin oxidoreductase [Myxococcus guangdongensis]MCP3062217.1 TAT-variant-translocated molybdopterin oxidoreductase [Myxococcus guangdongensis]
MNTKRDGTPSQESSSFALPVVSDRPAKAPDAVGEALDHAAQHANASEHGYGQTYWRSLEEKLGASEYMEETRPEFPAGADLPPSGFVRREFMQLLGASLALAGATACSTRPQDEKLLPYTKTPPEVTPGNPLHYASAMTLSGHTSGLLITAREGRPVKIEGNPDHPINQGAACTFEQAWLLSLYDPSRARVLRQGKSPRALRVLNETIAGLANKSANGGSRVRFLTEAVGSPLTGDLRNRILKKLPNARFFSASSNQDTSADALRTMFGGQHVTALYDFANADVVLSLDADFLESCPGNLRHIREFADRRDPRKGKLNRLYMAEARFSITGGMADHRKRLKSREILGLAAAVAQAVGGSAASLAAPAAAKSALRGDMGNWVQAVAADLRAAGPGRSLVIAGERQPAAVHALAHALNDALGNANKTVRYVQASIAEATGLSQARALVEDIEAGRVDTLVITAYNPVYTLPADIGLAKVLSKEHPNRAKLNVIYTGLYEDETSAHVDWFIPAAHPLETWSDGRSVDGTVSIAQPLIQPLFAGVPEAELLAMFLDEPFRPAYQLLRDYWRGQSANAADFEARWETWVSQGFIENTASAAVGTAPDFGAAASLVAGYTPPASGDLELNFINDYKVYDGRFGNNSWLQELPEPITKMTWDNAALVGPDTAKKLSLSPGDLAELSYGGQKLTVPVWVVPGHEDDTVTVALGYGRNGLHEQVAKGVGFDVNVIRSSKNPWFDGGATLTKVRGSHKFSLTQTHWRMENRPIALDMPLSELENPSVATQHTLHRVKGELKLGIQDNLEPFEYNGYKWAMAIDLSRCTGCSACVIACQAENNIPVVGKAQVAVSREMNWLRIDRYFEGPENDPKMVMQPVACVHCEKAPCEYVCPVNATVHSDEGLNDMVYNRCVGTRYCSNNCPYKVRRFNYLHYTADKTATEKMLMNPDVTVRNRGVMEKCTYCVQRIERVRIDARVKKELIKEADLKTACQQTCAAQAIVFGSLHDEKQLVSQLHEDVRAYKLLHELGTRPRTAHLIRVRNPNTALEPAKAAPQEGSH